MFKINLILFCGLLLFIFIHGAGCSRVFYQEENRKLEKEIQSMTLELEKWRAVSDQLPALEATLRKVCRWENKEWEAFSKAAKGKISVGVGFTGSQIQLPAYYRKIPSALQNGDLRTRFFAVSQELESAKPIVLYAKALSAKQDECRKAAPTGQP